MINTEIQQEIIELGIKYKNNWGKSVDFVGLSSVLSQERLLLVMRLIVDTGDSVLVGFQKIKNLLNPYYKYLDSIIDISCSESIDRNCPLCGNNVRYFSDGNSYEFKCDTTHCIRRTIRGI